MAEGWNEDLDEVSSFTSEGVELDIIMNDTLEFREAKVLYHAFVELYYNDYFQLPKFHLFVQ